MNFWIGTSGYNYPEWKGSFYPEKLPSAKMLPYYAERFPTVEINYTFYRSPNETILDGWNKATPAHFKLTLKAPRRITHDRRLREAGDVEGGGQRGHGPRPIRRSDQSCTPASLAWATARRAGCTARIRARRRVFAASRAATRAPRSISRSHRRLRVE